MSKSTIRRRNDPRCDSDDGTSQGTSRALAWRPGQRQGWETSTDAQNITTEELRSLAPSKYGAKRTHVPALDRTFASKHEATVAVGLALRQEMGEIRHLRFQVPFPIVVNGVKVCTYVSDFVYEEFGRGQSLGGPWEAWVPRVADAKGYPTPLYRLKKKLVGAVYGIDVVEL